MRDFLPKTINPRHYLFKTMPIVIDVMCRRSPSDEMHMHDCAELWYALSGEAVHSVGNKTFRQTPGVCIAVPSFVPHTFCTIDSEDTPIFLRVNVFDRALRERGYDYFSYCDKRIYFDGRLLPIYHCFSGEALEQANNIAHRMSDEFSKHKRLSFDKLLNLYTGFLRLLGGEESPLKLKASNIERTDRILNAASYISEHYNEQMTIEKLCEITNMSRSGLSKRFTEITGVSPLYYLRCIRMSVARREYLLRGKRLSDIVKLTGVYDKAQLSRLFKLHFGVSPKEYKKEKQLRELKLDREFRQRYTALDELSEFFRNQNSEI